MDIADKSAQLLLLCRFLREKITADGIETLFPPDGEPIEDGSEIDGSPRITNEDVKGMIGGVDRIIDFFDGNPDLRTLLLRLSVNPSQF